MSETSKTAKIILVLYWGLGYNRGHIRSMAQFSTKIIFAVLDVSLIMGLNIGKTDKVFYINFKKYRRWFCFQLWYAASSCLIWVTVDGIGLCVYFAGTKVCAASFQFLLHVSVHTWSCSEDNSSRLYAILQWQVGLMVFFVYHTVYNTCISPTKQQFDLDKPPLSLGGAISAIGLFALHCKGPVQRFPLSRESAS